MSRPLTGIRVLDLTRLIPGPCATKILAEYGASVDKIEDTDAGDYLRHLSNAGSFSNAAFEALNVGKRSLAISLKASEGRDLFLRLVERADVVVESFRPGVLERLGLGWDTLRARNERVILCSISGYGQTGPLASRAGHDLNYIARAGILGLTGPAGGPPQVPGAQMADIAGGALRAAVAVLAAVLDRHATGRGQHLDVAMSEGAMGLGVFGLAAAERGQAEPRGEGVLSGGVAPYGVYRTRDGRWVALAALEPKFWTAFCAIAGLEPDMQALIPGPHQAACKARVAWCIEARDRDTWAELAALADCCLEPVLEPAELAHDAHLRARGFFGGQPAHMFQPRPDDASRAPGQGEHTDAILGELGLDEPAIASLRARGVVR